MSKTRLHRISPKLIAASTTERPTKGPAVINVLEEMMFRKPSTEYVSGFTVMSAFSSRSRGYGEHGTAQEVERHHEEIHHHLKGLHRRHSRSDRDSQCRQRDADQQCHDPHFN